MLCLPNDPRQPSLGFPAASGNNGRGPAAFGTGSFGLSYDAASNRAGFTDPEGGASTYAYDTVNRLTTLTPPAAYGTGSFGLSYDALSRRTQMTRPNGVNSNYTYDNLSRLLSVLHQAGASTIDGATYTVDAAGNRTSKTNQLAGVTSNYAYDAGAPFLRGFRKGGIRKCLGCPILTVDLRAGRDNEQTTGSMRKELS